MEAREGRGKGGVDGGIAKKEGEDGRKGGKRKKKDEEGG